MPTIRFLRDYEDRRTRHYTKSYKAGTVAFVHRSCATKAIACGDAVMIRDRFASPGLPSPLTTRETET